ncbi:MAG: hypothetical protein MJ240_03235 [Kiritimatiellae bacterium]|nr:hypothetical protein [Kiritimatiellia bacterium]
MEMKAGKVILVGVAASVLAAMAMPTRQELVQAKPTVEELMAEDRAALKAKKKTSVEVGEQALRYAEKADKEPVKYLLLQGAFNFFMGGEAYDKAADVINVLRTDVKEVPPDVIAELISRAVRRANAQKALRVFLLLRSAQAKARALKEIDGARKAAAAKPADLALHRQLAENLAILGDWKGALAEFAKLVDTPEGKVAANESVDEELPAAADFWWEFKAQTVSEDGNAFRVHAAVLYQRLIDDTGLDGLKITLAEKRVKAMADLLVGDAPERDARKPLLAFGTRPITITLVDGVEPVEFVYVKPGEFEKNLACPPACELVKSRLTYPFWIARKPLTAAQVVKGLGDERVKDSLKNLWAKTFGDNWSRVLATMSHHRFEGECDIAQVTQKYAALLPRNYVLRLISDAEFNRALYLGYGEDVFKGKWSDKVVPSRKEIDDTLARYPSTAGGMAAIPLKAPDDLGVWGMIGYGRTLVADCYLPEQLILQKLENAESGNLVKYNIVYPAKNPFFYVGEQEKYRVSVPTIDMMPVEGGRVERFVRVLPADVKNWHALNSMHSMIRLVIGPDLVGQWMKKNGKKK